MCGNLLFGPDDLTNGSVRCLLWCRGAVNLQNSGKDVSGAIKCSEMSVMGIKFESRILRNILLLVAYRNGAVCVEITSREANKQDLFWDALRVLPSAKYKPV